MSGLGLGVTVRLAAHHALYIFAVHHCGCITVTAVHCGDRTSMSDIYETVEAYETACKEHGVDPHPIIQEVFAVDTEDNEL